MPDNNTPPTAEQLVAEAQRIQQAQIQEHAREVNEIYEMGEQEYGAAPFAESSQIFADKTGDRKHELLAMMRSMEDPAALITHLANNEQQLERLAKLSPDRQRTELSRIEAQMSSHGHVSTGPAPRWKQPAARTGRVSDSDWKTTYGANLTDAQWHKEFDRRMAEKAKRR